MELITAVKENNINLVEKLILEKNIDINHCTKEGDNALTLASREGHIEVVKLLLETNININHHNNYCDDALTLASREGHTEVVKLLLKKIIETIENNRHKLTHNEYKQVMDALKRLQDKFK